MTFGAGTLGLLAGTTSLPTTPAAATPPVPTGEPGRIPVSTGSVNAPLLSKPSGVSGSDWKKYQSLTDKVANRTRPISSKNQQWLAAFNATHGATIGGGGGGGGGGAIPGGVAPPPGVVNPDLGLLTRPYENPFEQRNLWNLFPPKPGGQP
jgi:hypothetical protein